MTATQKSADFFTLNCDMRMIRNLRHLLFGKKIIMTVAMYSLEK